MPSCDDSVGILLFEWETLLKPLKLPPLQTLGICSQTEVDTNQRDSIVLDAFDSPTLSSQVGAAVVKQCKTRLLKPFAHL